MDPIQEYALRKAADSAFNSGNSKAGIDEVGKGFAEMFENLVGGTNEMQTEAGKAVDGLLSGEVKDIHEVMVAVNKAELSFKFLVEVRNKLIDAYKDLMSQAK